MKVPIVVCTDFECFTNPKLSYTMGRTEKARTENSAPSKMQGWKTRERKTRHQSAGVEKARKCIYSIDI